MGVSAARPVGWLAQNIPCRIISQIGQARCRCCASIALEIGKLTKASERARAERRRRYLFCIVEDQTQATSRPAGAPATCCRLAEAESVPCRAVCVRV
jgi:hypothetical protein